jgi:hypothetical protein
MCSTCFPRPSLLVDASLSSTGSSRASSPASTVLSKRCDILLPSRRTSFPSLGDTSVSLVVFVPWRTSEPPGPGVGNPVSPAGISLRSKSRTLPSSWGTSMFRLPCSNPTPAGPLAPDHCGAATWPLVCKKQRLPRKVFRSSIAWLSDSLSTLRGVSCLSTTQDSLPVAGQALLDGTPTRKVPMKGFKVVDYISFPLPKLCLAQLHRPKRVDSIISPHSSFCFGRLF